MYTSGKLSHVQNVLINYASTQIKSSIYWTGNSISIWGVVNL